MTSTRDFTEAQSDERDERAELDRLRAEVAEWRRRYEKGELRDIAFTNSANEGRAFRRDADHHFTPVISRA